MSDHSKKGRLPPISHKPSVSDNETEDQNVKKSKKKKSARSRSANTHDGQARERSSSRSKAKQRHSSQRDSGIGDQPTVQAEAQRATSPTKKKKKKPPSASHEALMSGDEGLTERSNAEQHPSMPKKQKKKKKKKRVVGSEGEEDEERADSLGLAQELGDLQEDVVIADPMGDSKTEEAVWAQPTMRSEPMPTVFIEQRSGFKTADKQKLARQRETEAARNRDLQRAAPVEREITSEVALQAQRVFLKIANSLQGLFAGAVLFHLIFMYILAAPGFDNFLEQYYTMALVIQCLYYWLYAVSTVAIMDRYDIGNPTLRFVQRAFTLQSGAVSVLFYIIGLTISVSIAHIDRKISMFKDDDPLWEDDEARDSELQTWLILNLIRGLCAIIGWLIISLFIKPTTDRLSKNLMSDQNLLDEKMVNNDFEV